MKKSARSFPTKMLSLLLAMVMLISLMPAQTIFAADSEPGAISNDSLKITVGGLGQISSLNIVNNPTNNNGAEINFLLPNNTSPQNNSAHQWAGEMIFATRTSDTEDFSEAGEFVEVDTNRTLAAGGSTTATNIAEDNPYISQTQDGNKITVNITGLDLEDETERAIKGFDVESVYDMETEDGSLLWSITLKNTSDKYIEFGDVGLPMPWNNKYASTSDTYNNRLTVHTFAGADSGYAYGIRCSGEGNYMVFTPVPTSGARIEYVDNWLASNNGVADNRTGSLYTNWCADTGGWYPGLSVYYVHSKAIRKTGRSYFEDASSLILAPGESETYEFKFSAVRAGDNDPQESAESENNASESIEEREINMRSILYNSGMIDAVAIPSFQTAINMETLVDLHYDDSIISDVKLDIQCVHENDPFDEAHIPYQVNGRVNNARTGMGLHGATDYEEAITFVKEVTDERGEKHHIYKLNFSCIGNNSLRVDYKLDVDGEKVDKFTQFEFNVLAEIDNIIETHADFMANVTQDNDASSATYGIYSDWYFASGRDSNERSHWGDDWSHDNVNFMAMKNYLDPKAEEVESLERYLIDFMWENYMKNTQSNYIVANYLSASGIYGTSSNPYTRTFSEVMEATAYFNMYRIVKAYPDLIEYREPATFYLEKAYGIYYNRAGSGTTGFYGEQQIPDMIEALYEEGMVTEGDRLKNKFAKTKGTNIVRTAYPYGSEFEYDNTGEEGAYSAAKALKEYYPDDTYAASSMAAMSKTNKKTRAMRGLQPTWYQYADPVFRGGESWWNFQYTASLAGYIMDDYLRYEADGVDDSSAWAARMNYGGKISNFNAVNMGQIAATYVGNTSWRYNMYKGGYGAMNVNDGGTRVMNNGWQDFSGEADEGLYGSLLTISADVANDAIFGLVGYGCNVTKEGDTYTIVPTDGIGKRFNLIDEKIYVVSEQDVIAEAQISEDAQMKLTLDCYTAAAHTSNFDLSGAGIADGFYEYSLNGERVGQCYVNDNEGTIALTVEGESAVLEIVPLENGENEAPSATIEVEQGELQAIVPFELTAVAYDDGAPVDSSISYSWTASSEVEGAVLTLGAASSAATTAVANKAGTYHVVLTVSDGEKSSEVAVDLEIGEAPERTAPVINALTGTPIASNPSVADLSVDATADVLYQGTLAYEWTVTSKPEGAAATVAPADEAQAKLLVDKPGEYVVHIKITDEDKVTESDLTVTFGEKADGYQRGKSVITTVGTAPVLPETVEAILADGSVASTAVAWDEIDASKYAAAGTFLATGIAGDAKVAVTVYVVNGVSTNIAPSATATAIINSTHDLGGVAGLNDGYTPSSSSDTSHGAWHNWLGEQAGTAWVQYTWAEPYVIDATEAYYFRDGNGNFLPKDAKYEYLNEAGQWEEVPNANGLGVERNTFNKTTFDPISTTAIRMTMNPSALGCGILEWRVFGYTLDKAALSDAIAAAQALEADDVLTAAIAKAQNVYDTAAAQDAINAAAELLNAVVALKNAIVEAQATDTGIVEECGVAILTEAVAAANAVYTTETEDAAALNAAAATLDAAVDAAQDVLRNLRALKSAIESATALAGEDANLIAAIAKAQNVLDTKPTDNDALAAAVALLNASVELKQAIDTAEAKDLQNYVAEAVEQRAALVAAAKAAFAANLENQAALEEATATLNAGVKALSRVVGLEASAAIAVSVAGSSSPVASTTAALNDNVYGDTSYYSATSSISEIPLYHTEGTRTSSNTITYTWENPVTIRATDIFFWYNGTEGNTSSSTIRFPNSYTFAYLDPITESYVNVTGASGYGRGMDDFNLTNFNEITTKSLRVTISKSSSRGIGIEEWKVYGEVYDPETSVNNAPVVTANAEVAKYNVSLNGSYVDDGKPFGAAVTSQWTLVAAPEGAETILKNADSLNADFYASVPGEYEFTLTVSDSDKETTQTVIAQIAASEGGVPGADVAPNAGNNVESDYTSSWENLFGINDPNFEPESSSQGTGQGWGNWSQSVGSEHYVGYTWSEPVTIGAADVYWYDDGGGTQVPSAYRMQYMDENGQWQDVNIHTPVSAAIAKNQYNRIDFDTVTTNRIRFYVTVKSGAAANGIYRLKYYPMLNVASLDPASTITELGTIPTLPATVGCTTVDGVKASLGVVWETVTADMVAEAGDVIVKGISPATGHTTTATIYVRENQDEAVIASFEPVELTTEPGVVPELPTTVVGVYDNGAKESFKVTWADVTAEALAEDGVYTFEGTVARVDIKATLTIKVGSGLEPVPGPAGDVVAMIDAIGEVTYNSKEAVEAARAAYDALSDEDKALVRNYDVLVAAEAAIEAQPEAMKVGYPTFKNVELLEDDFNLEALSVSKSEDDIMMKIYEQDLANGGDSFYVDRILAREGVSNGNAGSNGNADGNSFLTRGRALYMYTSSPSVIGFGGNTAYHQPLTGNMYQVTFYNGDGQIRTSEQSANRVNYPSNWVSTYSVGDNLSLDVTKFISNENVAVTAMTLKNTSETEQTVTVRAASDFVSEASQVEIGGAMADELIGTVNSPSNLTTITTRLTGNGFALNETGEHLEREVTVPAGESVELKVVMAFTTKELPGSTTDYVRFAELSNLEAVRAQKAEYNLYWAQNLPYIEVPNLAVQKAIMYRWWSERFNSLDANIPGYDYQYPITIEGVLGYNNAIVLTQPMHLQDTKWLRTPTLAYGQLLSVGNVSQSSAFLDNPGNRSNWNNHYGQYLGEAGLEAFQVIGGSAELAENLAYYFGHDATGQLEHYGNHIDGRSLIAYRNNYMTGNDADTISMSVRGGGTWKAHGENAYVWAAADAASELYSLLGDTENAEYYGSLADKIQTDILELLWCDEDGKFETYAVAPTSSFTAHNENNTHLVDLTESNNWNYFAVGLVPTDEASLEKYKTAFEDFTNGEEFPVFPMFTANQVDNQRASGSNNFSNINFTVQARAYEAALRTYDRDQEYITEEMLAMMTEWMAWLIYPNAGDVRYPNNNEFYNIDGRTYDNFYRSWIYHNILGNYNYIFFEDMAGLTPRSDDKIELFPIDFKYDHFMINNARYHGHDVSVLWDDPTDDVDYYEDMPEGYTLYIDGERALTLADLGHVVYDAAAGTVEFPDGEIEVLFVEDGFAIPTALETEITDARTLEMFEMSGIHGMENVAEGAEVTASFTPETARAASWAEKHRADGSDSTSTAVNETKPDPQAVVDGTTVNMPFWGNYGSTNEKDSLIVKLDGEQKIDMATLYFYNDRQNDGYAEPAKYSIEYWDGEGWQHVQHQTRYPAQPQANYNQVLFSEVTTDQIRVTFTNKDTNYTAVTEIQLFAEGGERDTSGTNNAPTVVLKEDTTQAGNLHTTVKATVTDDGVPYDKETSYEWTLLEKPEGAEAILSGANKTVLDISASMAGEYKLRFVVSDGELSAEADITVTINESASGGLGEDVAPGADVESDYTSSWEKLSGINDPTFEPGSSNVGTGKGWGNWSQSVGSEHYVGYIWNAPVTIGGADVYWYDDGGGTQVPSNFRMQYRDSSGNWQDVNISTPVSSAIAKNQYNRIEFTPVTTSHLRFYVTVKEGAAANGIYRFKVYASVDIDKLDEVHIATAPGVIPTLPATVNGYTKDGALISVPVTWETLTADMVATDGEVVLKGINASTGKMTKATIYVRSDMAAATITDVAQTELTVKAGEVPTLPAKILVGYNNGAKDNQNVAVTWPAITAADLAEPGDYTYEGEVEGTGTKALLIIHVLENLDFAAAQPVIALIDAIGEVTLDSKEAIEAARAAYDALEAGAKGYVTNIETLTDAESTYATLVAVKEVEALIDLIPDEVTLESADAINTAYTAYRALSSANRRLVSNADKLTSARTTLQNMQAAQTVIEQIDAIGEVTLESEEAIVAARAAYDALSDARKAYVTNLAVLEAAEARLAQLKDPDSVAAAAVEELINAIGEVTVDSKEAIEVARAAYDALTDDQKAKVTNYQTLVDAEAAYAELTKPVEPEEVAYVAIEGLSDLNADDTYVIVGWRYFGGDDSDSTNGYVLTAAGDGALRAPTADNYATITPEANYEDTALWKIVPVEGGYQLQNVGTGKYIGTSLPADADEAATLTAASGESNGYMNYTLAYNDRSIRYSGSKNAFSFGGGAPENEVTGTNACNLTIYKVTGVVQPEPADDVIALIDAIGEVTVDSKEAIEAARAAYDALDEDQKAKVTNYQTLVDAEAAYAELMKVSYVAIGGLSDLNADDTYVIVGWRYFGGSDSDSTNGYVLTAAGDGALRAPTADNYATITPEADYEDTALWKIVPVEGGYQLQNVGTGKYIGTSLPADADEAATLTAATGESNGYTNYAFAYNGASIRYSGSKNAFSFGGGAPENEVTGTNACNLTIYKVTSAIAPDPGPGPGPGPGPDPEPEEGVHKLLALSDYQWSSHSEYQKKAEAIFTKMAEEGVTGIELTLMGGDYVDGGVYEDGSDTSLSTMEARFAQLKGYVTDQWPNTEFLAVQGNHDSSIWVENGTLDATGAYEYEDYIVYLINEDDFPWWQAGYSSYSDTAECKAAVEKTSEELDDYLTSLAEEGNEKPVIIITHVPLHWSSRTTTNAGWWSDNIYAKTLFDVVNEAAPYQDILFLFGHNHSESYPHAYPEGGSVNLFVPGDTIRIPDGTVARDGNYTEETINFVYTNAGYIGYVNTNFEPAVSTASLITITEDKVVIEKYSEDGLYEPGSYTMVLGQKDQAEPELTIASVEEPTTRRAGDAENFTAELKFGEAKSYSWTVNKEDVVKITSENGKPEVAVEYVGSGDAVLTCTVTCIDAAGKEQTIDAQFAVSVQASLADEVEALIGAIGEITKDGKKAIDAARAAYDALSDANKAKVENVDALTAAEAAYAELLAAYDKLDAVIANANKLSEDDYTAESWAGIAEPVANAAAVSERTDVVKETVDAAAAAVTEAVKALVGKSVGVIALIDAIGEVTVESKSAIDAARAAYDALSIAQKSLVSNYPTLRRAEVAYENLLDEEVVDYSALKAAVQAADALNADDYTAPSWSAVNAARAYANKVLALSATTQDVVDAAAEALNGAVEALVGKYVAVIDLIDGIGVVGEGSLPVIEAARAAYEALSPEQQAKVNNYGVLVAAEKAYANLPVAPELDYDALDAVIAAADKLTKADYSAATWADLAKALEAAKTARADAKTQLAIDGAAEALDAAIARLVGASEAVIAQIDAIGTVTEASGAAIQAARGAYDALTPAQKALVSNYADLCKAELAYENLISDSEVDYSALTAAIVAAGKLSAEDYTAETWAAVVEALVAADKAFESDDQAAVDAATKALNDAVAALVEVACPSEAFEDVPAKEDWAHAGIDYCVANGLMQGVSDTIFNPNGIVSRAQLVTILYRAEGEPEVAEAESFVDVEEDQWYTDAIKWAAANGIVQGVGGNKFNPAGEISREQIATILYRYAKYKDYDVSAAAELTDYVDGDDVSEWALEGMQWAVGAGIINGVASGDVISLAPAADATRAQIATIIMRFLEK